MMKGIAERKAHLETATCGFIWGKGSATPDLAGSSAPFKIEFSTSSWKLEL